jgi:restriction endonuclease S subunit
VSGWPEYRLGEVCEIIAGQSPPSTSYNSEGAGIPFYQGKKEFGARDVGPATMWTSQPSKIAEAGDILMSVRAPVGPVNFVNQRVCIGRGLAAIRAGKRLDPDFLFYNLLMREREIAGKEGAIFASISRSEIAALKIPLPPLEEQRRIVAVLDEAFAAISTATANAEKNLANAREMRALLYDRAFAEIDGRQALGELASFRNGVNFTSSSRGEEVRIVGVKDFQNNVFVPTDDLASVQVEGALADDDLLRTGDILTVRSNGNKARIGRCMIATDVEERTTHSGFTIRIRADHARIDPEYLCRYLKSPETRKRLVESGAGANISSLNQKVLVSLPVPVPMAVDQRRIVETLRRIDELSKSLESLSREKRARLAALKQSSLHRAFAGELSASATPLSNPANDNFSTSEFAAQVLAFAHARHVARGRPANFGHVKAQKTLHAVEAIGGLDLGRQPIRDAAGPNDFAHMGRAEACARQQSFFEFVQRTTGGYYFRALQNYDKLIDEAKRQVEHAGAGTSRAIELLVDMDSDWAEIVVTTHAAWNNLILDCRPVTDDAIVRAAREDWHPAKLRHDPSRFHDAIRFIRQNSIEPTGSAKRVGGQESLAF